MFSFFRQAVLDRTRGGTHIRMVDRFWYIINSSIQNRGRIGLVFISILLFHMVNVLDNPDLSWLSPTLIFDSFFYWITAVFTIGDRIPLSTLTQALFLFALFLTYSVVGKYIKDTISPPSPENRFSDDVLQVSLSFIHKGQLVIERLLTDKIEVVLKSSPYETYLIRQAIEVAKKSAQDDPFLRFSAAESVMIYRLLKPFFYQILNRDIASLTKCDAELEEVMFWVTFTWEKYGLKRNLIPRLILVPAWSLQNSVLQNASHDPHYPHTELRIRTMKKMCDDIMDGKPQVSFSIKAVVRSG